MPGAASESSVKALHRVLPTPRPNTPSQAAGTATPFSELLDAGKPASEPRERPDPAPRENAPRQTGFSRSKPAAKAVDRRESKGPASNDAPARSAPADGKTETQDAKEATEGEKNAAAEETTKAAETDASITEASNIVADAQASIDASVAAVLPVPVAPAAPPAASDDEASEEIALAPAAAPALTPADEALAAEAGKAEKPAATAKPAAEEQKDDEKAAKAETKNQGTELKQAVEAKDRPESGHGEKHAAHADAKEAKEAKPSPENEPRLEAPRVEAPAPARAGAEQNLTLTQATQQAAAPAQTAAAAQGSTPASDPVPVSGLAVEIAAQSRAGKNRFDIRLDPPELGRINVRLEVDNNGHVTSHLIVDRVETLDLLRRDAQHLERALEQAGLKTSENGLQFSLRDQSPQNQDDQNNPRAAHLVIPEAEIPELAQRNYGRLAALRGGLDIRV